MVETACVAQVVAGTVSPPQRGGNCAAVHALAALRKVFRLDVVHCAFRTFSNRSLLPLSSLARGQTTASGLPSNFDFGAARRHAEQRETRRIGVGCKLREREAMPSKSLPVAVSRRLFASCDSVIVIATQGEADRSRAKQGERRRNWPKIRKLVMPRANRFLPTFRSIRFESIDAQVASSMADATRRDS